MAHARELPSPPLRFQGFDVSKATFDVARWGDQDFSTMALAQYPRSPQGARAWLASIPVDELEHTGIVLESTGGYCQELARWLLEACPDLHVAIENPYIVKSYGRSLALRNKTDRMDARLLARYGQDRQPSRWVPLPAVQEELRSLMRTRAFLSRMLVDLRNRLTEHDCPSVLAHQAQQALVKDLEQQLRSLNDGIEELCERDTRLAHWMDLLTSIPGVGPITAGSTLGEAGDLRRFERRGQLVAFLGVSPRVHTSGTSVHGRTRMCRIGDAHARSVLYMAAVSASRTKGPIGDFYRNLVERGKPKRAALGALMRKLVVIMRAVLIQDKPYEVRQKVGA